MGAPDPRVKIPSDEEVAAEMSWDKVIGASQAVVEFSASEKTGRAG